MKVCGKLPIDRLWRLYLYILGPPGGLLGASWGLLEASWGLLEASWCENQRETTENQGNPWFSLVFLNGAGKGRSEGWGSRTDWTD